MKHPACQGDGKLDQVGREGVRAVLEDVDALPDLEPVTGEATEGLLHCGEEGNGAGSGGLAGLDHEFGEVPGIFIGLHESSGAGFDVEDQAVKVFGELLAHDAGGDEEGALDGAGVVAQPVENAISGDEGGGLAGHSDVAFGEDAGEVGDGELGVEAGDGFKLVEGAAGVAEGAAGDHGDGETSGGDDGGNEEAGLVANAACGVLVHAESAGIGAVEGLTREAHGAGEGGEFLGVEAALEDGHQKAGDLGVGGGVGDDGGDEGFDLWVGEGVAVPLAKDEVDGMDLGGHSGGVRCSRWNACGRRAAMVVSAGSPPVPG